MGLKWGFNGFNFLDYGVHVSASKGLLDKLKPRDRASYTWAEYHGKQIDLSKPKYEAREIELTCWIKAESIDELTDKFNAFLAFFDKGSTVRFSLTPFNEKPYAFEVILNNQVELAKELREGEIFGSFTLNLLEPNPIKKVLKTSLDSFRLKYDSSAETEIFFGDGTKQTAYGNVNFVVGYDEPHYQPSGISIVQGSTVNNAFYEVYTIPSGSSSYQFSVNVKLLTSKNIKLYVIGKKLDSTYEVIKSSGIFEGSTGYNSISCIKEVDISQYTKFFFKVLDSQGAEIPGIIYSNPRIESAEIIGEWQNMLGKEKIIIIAGDIDEVKNLDTPAEEIWNKI